LLGEGVVTSTLHHVIYTIALVIELSGVQNIIQVLCLLGGETVLAVLRCLCRHKTFTGIEVPMHWFRPGSMDERMRESDAEQ
jgi:hypothetical protein